MNNPKVSIGMPVYNGAQFLTQTLDAILAQTFLDFELIIADNASLDATEKICRKYAAREPRIRYYRNQQNRGAAWNFNRVFQLSCGQYFKWAAHDDLFTSNYLAKCVEILDRDRSVVLCHSQVQIIDRQGQFCQHYYIKLNTDSSQPQKRFHALLSQHLCYQIFGLIRSSTLRMTSLMGSYGHTDGVLLASIGLRGKFHEIPEPLFFARSHPQQSMSLFAPAYLSLAQGNISLGIGQLPDYYAYAVWFDPAKKGQILFPHWRILSEYLRCLGQASLSPTELISCYLSILKQFRGMKFLAIKDLIVAVEKIRERLIFNFRSSTDN